MPKPVLLTDELKQQLPRLYAQEKDIDPMVYVKFFTPWTYWTWYVTEGEAKGEDFLLYGYVIGQEREWGYFTLGQLLSVLHPSGLSIERDLHFRPRKASCVRDIHTHYRRMATPGGEADNLANRQCRVCRQLYDTPHLSDCPRRRNPALSNGKLRTLVKKEDIDL